MGAGGSAVRVCARAHEEEGRGTFCRRVDSFSAAVFMRGA